MSRVSAYKIDKNIESEMFRKFWSSIPLLRDASAASSFFSDLLTDTEEVMLAKRFTIAILLLSGKRPLDIRAILHVSYSTIGTVSSWLKNAKPQTTQLLKHMMKESTWESFIDQIDAALDALPPRYGTDWSKAGKAKWKRKMERASRQSLR